MQINPIHPLHLISPVADIPIVTPATAVGTQNQTDTSQTGSQTSPHPKTAELQLNFPAPGATDVEDTLRSLEEAVQAAQISLEFSRDEETGAIVVKLVDQTSGETVQQIPSEVLLHLSAALGKLQGQLFDQQA